MKRLLLIAIPLLFISCSGEMTVKGLVRQGPKALYVIDTGTQIYRIDSSLGRAYCGDMLTVRGMLNDPAELDINYIDDVERQ